MIELLTAAQMRAIEAAAIASGEVTGLELMERAGNGVVEAIFAEWPALGAAPRKAVVLCGPGNNGGDGFVVARLLKERGWEVNVYLYGDAEKLPPDARVNYQRWRGLGENVLGGLDQGLPLVQAEVLVDALFGTGLSRPLEGFEALFANIYDAQNNMFSGPRSPWIDVVVAVDILSGTCADSGRILTDCAYDPVCADLTVSFHNRKIGHVLSEAWAEKVVVADIGLSRDRLFHTTREAVHWRDIVRLIGRPSKVTLSKREGHKYSHGHVLILSGGAGRGGAARLAARGALRIGAGLVTVGCPPEALTENAARLDAVMLTPVADADALAEALEDKRITALCLGPGLGLDGRARSLLEAALGLSRKAPPPPSPSPPHEGEGGRRTATGANGANVADEALPLPLVGRGEGRGAPRPTVLDADALTLLSQDPGLFAALHENCILTPHAGEFARLFPDIAEKLGAPATKGPAYSKVDATREAARRAGCTVLYKGPDTVIADPSGRCSINSAHYDRAAPWLATAGSGDVLAGFITGLLARGFAPMQAAETAAWLHVECARKFGPGLIAEDLPEQLPAVFRDLGL